METKSIPFDARTFLALYMHLYEEALREQQYPPAKIAFISQRSGTMHNACLDQIIACCLKHEQEAGQRQDQGNRNLWHNRGARLEQKRWSILWEYDGVPWLTRQELLRSEDVSYVLSEELLAIVRHVFSTEDRVESLFMPLSA